jgi:multidrug efflux pump subunit AcrA (membrane-fusion protein)
MLVLLPSEAATPPAPTAATVQRGDVTTAVSAAGTVTAVNSRTLSFGAGGTVATVNVKAGDTVKVGQTLARLETDELSEAVDKAVDSVCSAEDSLARAEDEAEAQAQAQAQASPSPGPSAAASGGATPSGGANPSGGNSTGGGSQNGGGSDAVLAATQRLNNAELTLAEARRSLSGATITAPVAGKVFSVSGAVGAKVAAGSAFIVVGGLTDVAVSARFTEADIAELKLDQAATVTMASREGEVYEGRISQIDPLGTTSGRLVTYGAVIDFADPPEDLLLGQTANVIVTTAAATGVLYVPSAAVTAADNGVGTVTVRTAAGDIARSVETGLRAELYIEIKSGLAEGDVVLVAR